MDTSRLVVASALAAICSFPALADAQRVRTSHAHVSEARDVGEYRGVRGPGQGQPPRQRSIQRRATRRRAATLLTWPGFSPSAGGTFFLQLSSPVQPETNMAEGRFEVILRNVRTHARNTRRPLRTQYFNTPVTMAKVERRGRRDLAVVFTMRAATTPRVRSEPGAGGYFYVYVEFPAGSWLPEELARERVPEPAPEPEPEPARQDTGLSQEEMNRMDGERPPGM